MINVALIIPAAGIGKRFSENIKKQFYEFDSKPIIYWTIIRLFTAYKFDELVIGLNDEDINYMENIIEDLQINVPVVYARKVILLCVVINVLKSVKSDGAAFLME